MRPLIGITKPDRKALTQNLALRICVLFSGGKTVNITPSSPKLDAKISGLILSGGTDIHPSNYFSSELKKGYRYDEARDELEAKWIDLAQKKQIPVLGICRGAQLMNVKAGGTLYTNIARAFEEAHYPSSLLAKIFFRKKILIKEKGHLCDAFGKEESKVNSMHNQAIKKLGTGFRITAQEPNGIVQAIESPEDQYRVGVQFHPEFLLYKKEIRKLFKDFVASCKDNERDRDGVH